MPYQCLDCSYKGDSFPDGVCPGCGSHYIRKLSRKKNDLPITGKPYRLILAVVLWIYLLFEIYKNIAGGRGQIGCCHLHSCGFSGTILTENTEDFSSVDINVDIVENPYS